jgi:hypothetical protein
MSAQPAAAAAAEHEDRPAAIAVEEEAASTEVRIVLAVAAYLLSWFCNPLHSV